MHIAQIFPSLRGPCFKVLIMMDKKKIYFLSLHMNHSICGSYSVQLITMSVIVHSAIWAEVALFSLVSAACINRVHIGVLVSIFLSLYLHLINVTHFINFMKN